MILVKHPITGTYHIVKKESDNYCLCGFATLGMGRRFYSNKIEDVTCKKCLKIYKKENWKYA